MHFPVVNDLLILVILIIIFLLLSILRPYVRSFSAIEGFLVLPALSLLICIGIFPAFGFRPEIIPLTLFSLMIFILGIPRLFDLIRSLRTDDYGERPIGLVALSLIFLLAVSSFALLYTPRVDFRKDSQERATISTWSKLIVNEKQGSNLNLNLYLPTVNNSEDDNRYPLIILSPPLSTSIDMVDSLINALLDHGFMVLRYSRPSLDFPFHLPQSFVTFIAGTTFSFAALNGAAVEEDSRLDLDYLSHYVHSAAEQGEAPFNRVDPARLILVGFGAGGAAGISIAASPSQGDFAAVVAIEAVLYSALVSNIEKVDIPEEKSKIARAWHQIRIFFQGFKIQRIAGTVEVPSPSIPTLFICSDRVSKTSFRDNRYATVLRALRTSTNISALSYVDGASLFAYSEIPETYPVYEAFARGLQDRKGSSAYYVDKAATLIANFVSILPLEAAAQGFTVSSIRRGQLGTETHIEAGGTWNDAAAASILQK